MGMTDRQFASFRKQEMKDFASMLELAKIVEQEYQCSSLSKLILKLENSIEDAKSDFEI
jgi:hypothetical protein